MQKIIQNTIAKSFGIYINLLSYVVPDKAFAIAYKLFSQPRKGKLNKKDLPKTLQQATLQNYSHNEHVFQTYLWSGNDDTILLIHGWESNTSRWKKSLKHLQKTGKTIIAIDAPAHGLTSGKEFNVFIYSEFINKIVELYNPKIVIGHSLGGYALCYFQAHYKNNFEKMILLGAPSDFKIILNNYIKLLGLNNKIHSRFLKYTKQRFAIEVDDFSASKFLKNTSIRGIIAHDIEDKVVDFNEAKKLATAWKNANFIQTTNLGHGLHDENLYQTIVEFINSK